MKQQDQPQELLTNSESQPQLRQQILAKATSLFVVYGFNGVSMREIAAEAGLSKAGLYYHFKDKRDLFLAILNQYRFSVADIPRLAINHYDTGVLAT